MDETITVVHISPQLAEQIAIRKMLRPYPQIKLIAQLETIQEALLFCASSVPNIVVVYVHPLAEGLLDLLEQLIEVCPCSSFMVTYEHLPTHLIEAMKVLGVEYFVPKPIPQGIGQNILFLVEQRKRSWD